MAKRNLEVQMATFQLIYKKLKQVLV